MSGKKGDRNPKPRERQEGIFGNFRPQAQEEEEENEGVYLERLSLHPHQPVLQAMQQAGASSEYIESLFAGVAKRVHALSNLQLEHAKVEVAYEKEMFALEEKYYHLRQPFYAKIVNGEDESTTEEQPGEECAPSLKLILSGAIAAVKLPSLKGIPGFWLTVLQNNQKIGPMIEQHDIPVLNQYLTDITVEYIVDAEENLCGYALHFSFAPNEYFKNAELVKKYFEDYEGEEDEFIFQGPCYAYSVGCVIDWNDGKDVTVTTEKKKQKKKKGKDAGKTRTVIRTVRQPSFFRFFDLQPSEDNDEDEDEDEDTTIEDFEIGEIFKDMIIPHAVMWYRGDVMMSEDGLCEVVCEGDNGEEDYDDDDDDDDPEPEPPQPSPAKGRKGKGGR